MKKILAVMLVLAMVLSMVACGGASEEEATWEDQLGTPGVFRVGMSNDYPPYEADDGNGGVVGFDADMAQLIADELGLELEIVPMQFETIISAVAAGTVDAGIACFSYTDERAQSVLFTDTYMYSSQAIFVAKDSGIKSIEDLAGGTLGAGDGTTGMDVANEIVAEYGGKTVPGYIVYMAEELKGGTLQGIVTEQCVAKAYVEGSPDDFEMLDDSLTTEEIKAVTSLNNPELNTAVNDAINKIMSDEEAYEALILKWFEN